MSAINQLRPSGFVPNGVSQSEIDAQIAQLKANRSSAADPAAAAARWASFTTPTTAAGLGRLGAISAEHGRQQVGSLDELLALARRGATAGASGVRSVKFLMVDADSADGELYLINGANHPYHYFFYKGADLGNESNEAFNRDTYVFFDRNPAPPHKNIAGTLFFYPNHKDDAGNDQPLLTFGFWPTDHVQADDINKISGALKEALDFSDVNLAYVPAGQTHDRLLERYRGELDGDITIKRTDELYANVDFRSMNNGVSYGYLNSRGLDALGPRDIAIFENNAPNDGLPHLRGFITGEQQGDGSHIQLLSEQDGIPNAMIKDPTRHPDLEPFINSDRPVRFEVTADGFSVREASQAEVDEHFEAIRPLEPVTLDRNLSKQEVLSFKDADFGLKDADAYGGKASALAELWNIRALDTIENVQRLDGYGLPFHFYQEFMTNAVVPDGRTFEAYADAMLADPDFQANPEVRRERLAELQEWMIDTPLPDHLHAEIDEVWDKRADFARQPGSDPRDVNVRGRSSGAGEDGEGWSGAGIYTSATNNQREDLKQTVRQVWSSWWNFEAIEERGFYKFEHLSGAMGIGLHQNFPDRDEVATGVAFTKSDAYPGWGGFQIHAQVGGGSVTNPNPGERHDSFFMADLTGDGEIELLYSSRSNRTSSGEPVLSPKMVTALHEALTAIHDHWAQLLGRSGDESFGIDLEYKVEGEGANETLFIKQVRPLVSAPVNHSEEARSRLAEFASEISNGGPMQDDHATALIDRVREEFAALSRPFPRKEANPKTLRFGVASALRDIDSDASAGPVLGALADALPKFAEGANVHEGQTVADVLDAADFSGLDATALATTARRALERDAFFRSLDSFAVTGYQPTVADTPGRVSFSGQARGRSYERTFVVSASGDYAPA